VTSTFDQRDYFTSCRDTGMCCSKQGECYSNEVYLGNHGIIRQSYH